jgi:hypothetical protein
MYWTEFERYSNSNSVTSNWTALLIDFSEFDSLFQLGRSAKSEHDFQIMLLYVRVRVRARGVLCESV